MDNLIPRLPRELNEAATAIIRSVYQLGSADAEPRAVLNDLARSTTVVGKLLEGLADGYQQEGKNIAKKGGSATAKKAAGWITTAGRIFWGLVEVSVPDSVLFYLSRNLVWIAELLGVLIILLGIAASAPVMWSTGIGILIVVVIAYQFSRVFHNYMCGGSFQWKVVKSLAVAIPILLIIIGACYATVHDGNTIADALTRAECFFRWAHAQGRVL
jgi:hypothetical protein